MAQIKEYIHEKLQAYLQIICNSKSDLTPAGRRTSYHSRQEEGKPGEKRVGPGRFDKFVCVTGWEALVHLDNQETLPMEPDEEVEPVDDEDDETECEDTTEDDEDLKSLAEQFEQLEAPVGWREDDVQPLEPLEGANPLEAETFLHVFRHASGEAAEPVECPEGGEMPQADSLLILAGFVVWRLLWRLRLVIYFKYPNLTVL